MRRALNPHPVQVVAVTGGKGGVGKTNVSVNLAMAMSAAGKDVMLMDADLGLANVDVLLGLYPKHTLLDVIEGRLTLEEIILDGPGNIKIVPASSGFKDMAQMTPVQHAGLIRAFSELSMNIDVLVVDTAAGISDSVISFTRAAQEIIVVICDEPASITDAYALIKLLNRDYGVSRFHILSNMARSAQEGREVYEKIVKVTDRFLDVALSYAGHIPYDEYVLKAIKKQRGVYEAFPRSKASMAFKSLADKAMKWPIPQGAGGHLEFFVERLIHGTQQTNAEVMP
ncbi:MAG: MinD/ParA family protein [Gammaproteobacteria bacterium]|nr:MinD/ParA family protein [Gammaproteobacteria bacterium]MDH5652171.1 MinD/ParA family protein [Gammaproteobacteria bacterium]